MDTFFALKSAISLQGFKTCQIFATEFGHVFIVPMEDKSGKNIVLAINRYSKEKGVPLHIIYDQVREQVKGDTKILCHDSGCIIVELEKGTPAANCAEHTIKILKDGAKKDMFEMTLH